MNNFEGKLCSEFAWEKSRLCRPPFVYCNCRNDLFRHTCASARNTYCTIRSAPMQRDVSFHLIIFRSCDWIKITAIGCFVGRHSIAIRCDADRSYADRADRSKSYLAREADYFVRLGPSYSEKYNIIHNIVIEHLIPYLVSKNLFV